jgi:hypothetical protein
LGVGLRTFMEYEYNHAILPLRPKPWPWPWPLLYSNEEGNNTVMDSRVLVLLW